MFTELRSTEVGLRHARAGVSSRLPYDYDVVTRRINQPLSSLRNVVSDVPARIGALALDAPFADNRRRDTTWHTTGRLYGEGTRLMRYTRVDVELIGWSEHSSELRVRPATRRVPVWGQRRQRRYFRLAHHVADDLAQWLDAAVRRHDAAAALRRSFRDRRTAGVPIGAGGPPSTATGGRPRA